VHFKRFDNLIKELERYLKGAIDGTVTFGNPVTDFLSTVSSTIQKTYKTESSLDETIGEKVFIDFLVDIEEKTLLFTDTIVEMTADLNNMTDDITKETAEINRVKQNGGSGTALFMRKTAKIVAESISFFAKKVIIITLATYIYDRKLRRIVLAF